MSFFFFNVVYKCTFHFIRIISSPIYPLTIYLPEYINSGFVVLALARFASAGCVTVTFCLKSEV